MCIYNIVVNSKNHCMIVAIMQYVNIKKPRVAEDIRFISITLLVDYGRTPSLSVASYSNSSS